MSQDVSGKVDTKAARRLPTRKRKAFWIKFRAWMRTNALVRETLASLLAMVLRFINLTNPRVPESTDLGVVARENGPAIVTLWHGQHIMAPFMRPKEVLLVAMFSRSDDAELNARVAEKLGIETVRGSGGREKSRKTDKGGARALLALKKILMQGKSAAMIADISRSTRREAGLGVVTLAKISGRPIIAFAYASRRRIVLEKTWDKTTIPLPFGRSAVAVGDPIFVPRDADDALLEEKREQVTQALNDATTRAYAMVDKKR